MDFVFKGISTVANTCPILTVKNTFDLDSIFIVL